LSRAFKRQEYSEETLPAPGMVEKAHAFALCEVVFTLQCGHPLSGDIRRLTAAIPVDGRYQRRREQGGNPPAPAPVGFAAQAMRNSTRRPDGGAYSSLHSVLRFPAAKSPYRYRVKAIRRQRLADAATARSSQRRDRIRRCYHSRDVRHGRTREDELLSPTRSRTGSRLNNAHQDRMKPTAKRRHAQQCASPSARHARSFLCSGMPTVRPTSEAPRCSNAVPRASSSEDTAYTPAAIAGGMPASASLERQACARRLSSLEKPPNSGGLYTNSALRYYMKPPRRDGQRHGAGRYSKEARVGWWLAPLRRRSHMLPGHTKARVPPAVGRRLYRHAMVPPLVG